MYCKQEPDETLIIIKSEWTRHLRDKILLRAERRPCNSNFSTERVKVYIPNSDWNPQWNVWKVFDVSLEMSSDPKNYFGFYSRRI